MTKPDHKSRAHSVVGASGYSRWSTCPGSVALTADMPNTSSIHAATGTVAHEICELCLIDAHKLANSGDAYRFVRDTFQQEGYSITVDEEMADAVNIYVETIIEDATDDAQLFVEHKFHLKRLHEGLFGTNDAGLFFPKRKHLTIYDFKYGAGIPVRAKANGQLLYYAIGALEKLHEDHGAYVDTVELVVIQPRTSGEPVERWSCDVMDVMDFAGELLAAVKRTEEPNAPLVAGSHCRFCPANGKCAGQLQQAMAAAKAEFA